MHGKIWTDMFVLGLPVLEKILRPLIIYLFLVVALRLAGKRELAQLNPFDLVVLLKLSNSVQNAIIGDDTTLTGGVIGATTLLAANYFVVRFLYAHERLDRLAEGAPDVLAILEPGGTLSFVGKKPAPEETRHQEVLARLNQIAAALARLPASQAPEQS
jgi:uncharacterized membrane protein YcaP (DUF421 family)